MPTAYSLIRPEPHYRRDAFAAGLEAVGYAVRHAAPSEINPGDVVLSWNRYGQNHDICTRVEAAGGIVCIAENGYVGHGGVSPHSMKVRDPYALGIGYHNDASVVRMGHGDRWAALGVSLQPWRADGGHVLVAPNRPFGTPGRAMPADWAQDVAARLAKLTKREIRIRPHPGNEAPKRPLAEDLTGAWAVVIWSSSAGVHALVAGIPVFCEAPAWICADCSYQKIETVRTLDDLEKVGDEGGEYAAAWSARRLLALKRLAWAQFHLEEIASGFAFTSLLRGKVESEVGTAA